MYSHSGNISMNSHTKFLCVFVVDDQRADQGGIVLSEGFICYGSVVQFICTESGVALPPMVRHTHAFKHTCKFRAWTSVLLSCFVS